MADRRSVQIGVIAAQDGALRVLKSGELRSGISSPRAIRFSPDGKYIGYDRMVDDAGLQHGIFVPPSMGAARLLW